MVAALYVQPNGIYSRMEGVEPWPESRDARTYAGPHPVVAHPPCAAWGRYSKPHPGSLARGPLRGDDGGCFAAALTSVRMWGGVLEHPQGSAAWPHFQLPPPNPSGGWSRNLLRPREWVCEVDQGHYGHPARKPTWLLYVGSMPPPALILGPSSPVAIGSGARRGNLESLSKIQRAATPEPFARLLVSIASALVRANMGGEA